MAGPRRWKHGWIPLNQEVAEQFGRKWQAPNGGISDTGNSAASVDSPFAQAAAHHLQQAAADAAQGHHSSARGHLEAAQSALKSGADVTADPRKRQALKDLHADVSKHVGQNTSRQADQAIRQAAGRPQPSEPRGLGSEDVSQLFQAPPSRGLQGAPKRGQNTTIDGVNVMITSVTEAGGALHIRGIDDHGNIHETTLRRR
jgi:hypothetical protein